MSRTSHAGLALLAVLGAPALAQGAFGDPDTTFGVAGLAPARIPNIAKPGPGPTLPTGIRMLSGGGVDVVAPTGDGARQVLARMRYSSALTRVGLVRAPFGVAAFEPQDSATYGGGFVTVGRTNTIAGTTALVVRTTATGTLDTTFGSHGVVRLPRVMLNSGSDAMYVARTPVGAIVVAMAVTAPGSSTASIRVTRLRANGALDSTFGSGGSILIPYKDTNEGRAAGLAVTADNKVVLGIQGFTSTGVQHDAILRRLPNGAPDTTFDGDGISTRVPPGLVPFVADVAVQPDGKIAVLATDYTGGSGVPVLYRLKLNGQVDTAFGAAGSRVNLMPTTATSARAAVLLRRSDGRYVAAGNAVAGTPGMWIGRTDANAQSATIVSPASASEITPSALAATTGKVVVAGSRFISRIALTALSDTDLTGAAAVTTLDAAGGVTEATIPGGVVFPDRNGGVFVASKYGSTLRIVALTAKGARNQTFGPLAGRGAITLPGAVGSGSVSFVKRLADGRIAVGISDFLAGSRLLILKADGVKDTSVVGGGEVALGASTGLGDLIRLADGRLVLAAGIRDAGLNAWVMRVVRLMPNGSVDLTFTGDGSVDLPYPAGTSSDTLPPGAVHVHAAGAAYVVVGGVSNRAVVGRVSTAGVPDPGVGGGSGVALVGPVGMKVFGATADASGRSIILGSLGSRAIALRLTTNLAPDPAFSGDGVLTYLPPAGVERFIGAAVMRDRSMVLQGLVIPSGGGFASTDFLAVSASGAIQRRVVALGQTFEASPALAPDGRFMTAMGLSSLVGDVTVRRLKNLGPSLPLNARRVSGATFSVSVDSRGLTATSVQIQARRNGRWVIIGRRSIPALLGRRRVSLSTTRRTSDTRFRAVAVNASGVLAGATFAG